MARARVGGIVGFRPHLERIGPEAQQINLWKGGEAI